MNDKPRQISTAGDEFGVAAPECPIGGLVFRMLPMVHLNQIYTRSGDDGTTGLGDGSRVPKTSARISAIGAVDELNAAIGLAIAERTEPQIVVAQLRSIQNTLFDLGADLAVPSKGEAGGTLRITEAFISRLENAIDKLNESLSPLRSFILPGGSELSARLHVARGVCRRAEIELLRLAAEEQTNPQAIVSVNRLSDYLFVACRFCNDGGNADILWEPGKE